MKNGVNKSTQRVAVCGIVSALGLALMMLTTIIPIGTYALPCFAGIFISAVVVEYGCKWALGVFAVVSILSLFLAGDKEAVLYFAAFFGYYPIFKCVAEKKIKSIVLQYIIKFILFNLAAVVSFFMAMFFLSVPTEEFTIFGLYLPFVFLVVANVFFLLYDFAVTVFVSNYVVRLRGKIFGEK